MFNFEIIDRIIHITIGIDFIANCLIYLAGILWGIELIPQVVKTIKTKNVEGISTPFFAICLTAYTVYMIGNSLIGNWNIIISHIPSLLLSLTMLILLIRYKKNEKKNN